MRCPFNGFVAWKTCRRSHPFLPVRSVRGAFDRSGVDGPGFSPPLICGGVHAYRDPEEAARDRDAAVIRRGRRLYAERGLGDGAAPYRNE